jgi:hypothetical protein
MAAVVVVVVIAMIFMIPVAFVHPPSLLVVVIVGMAISRGPQTTSIVTPDRLIEPVWRKLALTRFSGSSIHRRTIAA